MATGEKLVNLDSLKAVHDKVNGDVTDLKNAVNNGSNTRPVFIGNGVFTDGVIFNSVTGDVTENANYKILNKNLIDLLPEGTISIKITPPSSRRVTVLGFSEEPSYSVGDNNLAIQTVTKRGANGESIEVILDKSLYYIIETNYLNFNTITEVTCWDSESIKTDIDALQNAIDNGCSQKTIFLNSSDFVDNIILDTATGEVKKATNFRVLTKNLLSLVPEGTISVKIVPETDKRAIVIGFSEEPSYNVGDNNLAIQVFNKSGAANETVEVALDKNLYYVIETVSYIPTDVTVTVWDGIEMQSNIDLLKSEIGFMEVFPMCSVLTASISQSGEIKSNSKCRTIYFEAQPNTVYIIEKLAGECFVVGESAVIPETGGTATRLVTDNTATQIMYQTSSDGHYLVVFCYYSDTDIGVTSVQMCQGLRVFLPRSQTNIYQEKYVLKPYTIYDTKILPYYVYRKTVSGSLQSIAYCNGKIYVIKVGGIRIYAANGVPYNIDYADFAHPHYAEVYENTVLITSTDASDGRSLFSLDCDTLELTKLFSLSVNAVSISRVSDTGYKVIAWGDETNELTFYDYDSSTDTLTEIGNYTLDRKYYQGGSRINNIYYIMTNNGKSDSLVHIIDGDTFTKIGQITIKGLGECEGFFVYVEGESMYAWFVSNTLDKLVKVKLL